MKQTDFRDVPNELCERIEPLLAPFKRKRSGGSKPLAGIKEIFNHPEAFMGNL